MSFGTTALQVLRTVAPTLALAVGGPFGPLAATAISAVLGKSPDDTKGMETALLTATPDQLLALKKAEDDFQVQMTTLGIAEEKLSFDDTSNARLREMTVKDWTPRILAFGVVAITLIMEGMMLVYGQPKSIDGVVLGRILGTWDGATMLVLAYYFGSSAGSAAKTDAINKIVTSK